MVTLTFIAWHHKYKHITLISSSFKEPKQQLHWSTTVLWGVMFGTLVNVDVLLLEGLKTEQCRWPVSHLSDFSRGLSSGGITESWCIPVWLGTKDKYNNSSSFRFQTGPPAKKSLPPDRVASCAFQVSIWVSSRNTTKPFIFPSFFFFFLIKHSCVALEVIRA